jgi:hypothetical protein
MSVGVAGPSTMRRRFSSMNSPREPMFWNWSGKKLFAIEETRGHRPRLSGHLLAALESSL